MQGLVVRLGLALWLVEVEYSVINVDSLVRISRDNVSIV